MVEHEARFPVDWAISGHAPRRFTPTKCIEQFIWTASHAGYVLGRSAACIDDQVEMTRAAPFRSQALRKRAFCLEVESEGGRDGSRRDVVGAAEGREEVIERFFVGQIDNADSRALHL